MTKLILLAVTAGTLAAQPIENGARQRALSELHATAKMFTDSVAGLTPAQWNFKPGPDRWSIAECAEHLALTEDRLRGLIANSLKQPSNPPTAKVPDEKVLKVMADRSKKGTAPEAIAPKKTFATPEAAVAHFTQARNGTLEYVRTTQDDLRAHFTPHPAVGTLDAYQWLLVMAAHTDRHVQQINEVKASPGFPK